MKSVFTVILAIILSLAIAMGLVFVLGNIELKSLEWFGTRRASIQRQIFKENKSHIEGMAQDLAKYRFEYQRETDEVAKQAIESFIRSRFADFDANKLQDLGLRSFLREIRGC